MTEDRIARAREALELAHPIVEQDLETAKSYGDGDWIGLSQTALDAVNAALAFLPDDVSEDAWQPIETCETWRFDFQRPMLANWKSRGVCETYWDEDDDFDSRPKGWRSPRYGWRSPGDQCIPVNQDDVTHWQPLPAPPAAIRKATA